MKPPRANATGFGEHTRPRVFRPAPSPVGVARSTVLNATFASDASEWLARAPTTAREGACAPGTRAFTLLELMLVVAIMAIAMLISYPLLADLIHRPPMSAALKDMAEMCRSARELAILKDSPMELRIYPQSGRLEVGDAPLDDSSNVSMAPAGDSANSGGDGAPKSSRHVSSYVTTGQLSDRIRIELLYVNFIECTQDEVARVRFYPNGTCDEFTMVVNCEGDSRKISLQVVTALVDIGPVQ